MSLFRVYSGEIKSDATYFNPNKGETEKIGKLFSLCGKKQTEIKSVKAGDIGCVAKLEFTATGDTLCDKNKNIILTGIEFPPPVLSMAVMPEAKGDEENRAFNSRLDSINSQEEYQAGLKEVNAAYMKSLPWLEKAMELKPESVDCAEYLKVLCFRLRNEDGIMDKYNKYNALYKKLKGIQ